VNGELILGHVSDRF